MCGIAGIVEYATTQKTITLPLLQIMSNTIAHRGPDDEGHWISRNHNAGFAYRRLAIVDLSLNGHQPMTTPDGRYTIMFNGEVYNHLSLRKDLEQRGYVYRSKTDTETILYGFAEWGCEIIYKMVGMWGLAIWDEHKQELFCARDRIGIKPLYYTLQDGRFVFASEIKAILTHPAIERRLNYQELPNYLTLSMTGESTLFEGIHKLSPGHWLKLRSDGSMVIQEYWNPLHNLLNNDKPDARLMNEVEIQEEILRLLRQAVNDRMMSDVPFGAFLSGGIDSSVNVALMAELMDRPVDTFSVGFKELEKYNEMGYARRVASLFSTNHHEVLIDHEDALGVLEKLVWHEDEPNGDPVCIPLYFLSELARQNNTIVLQVGEGSDEQFAGYSWMHRELRFYHTYWKYFRSLPFALQRFLYSAISPALLARQEYLIADYLRRASEQNELYWGGAVDLTPVHLNSLFSKNFQYLAGLAQTLPERFHHEILNRYPEAEYLLRIAYLELRHRLPELLLMRVDKITMAHGLEARVPFLDHRLVEFTMTIPESVKIPQYAAKGGETKYLLKKAVEQLIPREIIYRKKQGFAAPVNEWFRKPLKSYWESMVYESPLVKTSDAVFDQKALEEFFAGHVSGRFNRGKSLYAILNLCLWHRRFIA